MFKLFPLFALLVSGHTLACTCLPISVNDAKESADIVFAGVVESVQFIDSKEQWEPRILLSFDVARVWKGDVDKSFTMHTNVEGSSCGGFFRDFLEQGENLIVYGFGRKAENWKKNYVDGSVNAASLSVVGERRAIENLEAIKELGNGDMVYTTDICSRTGLVLYAVDDFEELGEYKEYQNLDVKPDPIALDAITWKQNSLPYGCAGLGNARRWEVISQPPKSSKEFISLLEEGLWYERIPKPNTTKYHDYWVSDMEGNYGLCRRSVDPDTVCGQAVIEYSLASEKNKFETKEWKISSGSVQTYCKHRK